MWDAAYMLVWITHWYLWWISITRWHSQWLQLSFRSELNTILWYHVNLFSTFVMFSKCISIFVGMNYQLDQIHELSTLINYVSSFSS